eukprot:Plantae.Rhodophyta-Palmaria_palmata.ctg1682.p1 GENE.Plantae.Rhodophyta-Palmaria_palmata.ctg1682~~Plantae.Rhodophyta-Palmaria_palmata.ctg1682.p1  ORF type:complete len:107 (-),score=20.00 Plantae.Rhodophyta-Palmaria_palmata.ctg1682:500-820(-)
MKGICMAIDGTLMPLSCIPRQVLPLQAEAYKHHKNSWCMSNLFLVDAEGRIVDGNVGVPGRASDEGMLKKMSFYKGFEVEMMAEWDGWDFPHGTKIVADAGHSQRN